MLNNENNNNNFPITNIEAFWIVMLTMLQTAFYFGWRLANDIELNVVCLHSGSVVPLWTLVSTFIVELWGYIMFLANHLKQKFFNQGKAEGIAEGKSERDTEWIEWAENGKDPDKMPSKVNPVTTTTHENGNTKKS